jgi:hypothetical protein
MEKLEEGEEKERVGGREKKERDRLTVGKTVK